MPPPPPSTNSRQGEQGDVSRGQRNSVREWLNSLTDTTEVEGESTAAAVDGGAHIEDDLFLGAEAKSMAGMSPTSVPSKGPSPMKRPFTSLQQRFLRHTDSFDSGHSHKTYDSVEQILQERTGDPEDILTYLGFGGSDSEANGLAGRIPDRFLRCPSNAFGISPQAFLDNNPDIKEYVQMQMATNQALPAFGTEIGGGDQQQQQQPHQAASTGSSSGPKMSNTAQHLVLLQRLAGTKSRQLWAKPPVVEMSHRVEPHDLKADDGFVHSSILHPDNGNYLAKQGVYEAFETGAKRWGLLAKLIKGPEKPTKSPQSPKSPLVSGSPTTLHPNATPSSPRSPAATGPTSPCLRSPARSRSGSMNGTPVPERFILNPSVCDEHGDMVNGENVELIIPDHLQPQLKHMHPVEPQKSNNASESNTNTNTDSKTTSKSNISVRGMWDDADLPGMPQLPAKSSSTSESTSQPAATATSTEFETELEKKLDVLEKQLKQTDTFSSKSSSSGNNSSGQIKSQDLLSSSSSAGAPQSIPSESSLVEEKLEALDTGQSDHFSNSSSEQASVSSIKLSAAAATEVNNNSDATLIESPQIHTPQSIGEASNGCVDRRTLLVQSRAVQQSFELEEVLSSDMLNEDLPVFHADRNQRNPFSRTGSTQSDSSGFAELDATDSGSFAHRVKSLGSSNDSDVTVVASRKSPTRAISPKLRWSQISSKKESKVVTKEAKPMTKEAKPVKKEAKPVKNEATPVKNEAKPVTKTEAKPVKKEAKPVTKTETKPVSKPVIKKESSVRQETVKVPQKVVEVKQSKATSQSPVPKIEVAQPKEEESRGRGEERQSRTSQRLTFAPSRERALSPTRALSPSVNNSGFRETHIQLTVPPKRKKQEILTRLSSNGSGDGVDAASRDRSFVKETIEDEEELEVFENIPATWKNLRISSPIPQQSPKMRLKWDVMMVESKDTSARSQKTAVEVAYSEAQQSYELRTSSPSQAPLTPNTQRIVSQMFLVVEGNGRIKQLDHSKIPDDPVPETVWTQLQQQQLRNSRPASAQRLDSGFESLRRSLDDDLAKIEANGSVLEDTEATEVLPVRKLSTGTSKYQVPKRKGRYPWKYDQPIDDLTDPDVREKTNYNNNNAATAAGIDVRESRASSFTSVTSDVSEHQVICSLLKQAHYFPPDSDELLSKAEWPLFSKTKASTRQHLVEEVKLMQHALHKYKLEFRALEIRARTQYKSQHHNLAPEERAAWEEVCEMKVEVNKEISEMERLLGMRMKGIIAGNEISYDNTTDLASMQIINQMIELLKEQVYHGNIVNSMDVSGQSTPHPLLMELETASEDHDESMAPHSGPRVTLMDQLSLLQRQIESQQSQTTTVLNSSMRDLRHVLLEEIRNSIHSETQDLRYQVQAAEAELKTLKRQMSAPSELGKLMTGGSLTFNKEADIAESSYEM